MNWLGKILFPKTGHHIRRRQMNSLLAAVIVGLILSAILTVMMINMDTLRHP